MVPAWLHAPGERLRPQERHILDLIADGLTNRQIGAERYLAEKTVKNYVSSLLHKLGFSRRTEAVVHPTGRRRAGHRPPSTPTTTGAVLPAWSHPVSPAIGSHTNPVTEIRSPGAHPAAWPTTVAAHAAPSAPRTPLKLTQPPGLMDSRSTRTVGLAHRREAPRRRRP